MIELWFNGQKKRAQAVMTNRVNQQSIDEINGHDREILRSSFCKVVYLIPRKDNNWVLSEAVPVVSRDISINGLSVVHTQPVLGPRILVGLPGVDTLRFVQGEFNIRLHWATGFSTSGFSPIQSWTSKHPISRR